MPLRNSAINQNLLLLSYIDTTAEENLLIKSTLAEITDWTYWFETMNFNKTVPISYYHLSTLGLINKLPDWIRQKMETIVQEVKQMNAERNEEGTNFLKLFYENKIPVALLKGVALGEVVYHNPFYKRMNDIDILIQQTDLAAIYHIYKQLGYFCLTKPIEELKVTPDKIHHLSPAIVSKNLKCVIGNQWGIKSPMKGYAIKYDELWKRTRQVMFNGVPVSVLSPEDNLHHLCLHLSYFKVSLRDMMDFYNLLRKEKGKFNWELFYNIVKQSGTENPVYFSLKITYFLYADVQLDQFISRIKPSISRQTLKDAANRIQNLDVFFHLHSDYIQTIEKEIAKFESSQYFPEKFRFLLKVYSLIFYPPKSELMHMSAVLEASGWQLLKLRLKIPFIIFRVIAKEIGWLLLIGLLFKTKLEIILSFFKWPFISKSRNDLQAYANHLGLPLPVLQNLINQFQ